MAFIKLLALGLMTQMMMGQCNKGCLKCNSDNKCTLCDVSNRFYLQDDTCKIYTQSNCKILSLTGQCALCEENSYLNLSTNTCLEIPAEELTPDCKYYSTFLTCATCQQGFVIKEGQCVSVTEVVDNCEDYIFNENLEVSQCVKCKKNFIFNNDQKKCIEQPITDCAYYTYITCKECQKTKYFDKNYYLRDFYVNTKNVYDIISKDFNIMQEKWIPQLECLASNTVSNCKTSSTSNDQCTVCDTGYYLFNNQCTANPIPAVQFCSEFESSTSCILCMVGYFLSSNTQCSVVVPIDNCQYYSRSSSTSACVECQQKYYLSAGACVLRTQTEVENCLLYDITADKCSQCSSDYTIRTDGLMCIMKIINCNTYQAITDTNTFLTCTKCNEGFFVAAAAITTISNRCERGTIENCKIYTDANTCSECYSNYYKNANPLTGAEIKSRQCLPHTEITNCDLYSPTTKNLCVTCKTGYYALTNTAVCEEQAKIDNCLTYTVDGLSCSACEGGFQLDDEKKCTIIGIKNCKTFGTDGVCTACENSYNLVTLTSGVVDCIAPYDFMAANCAKLSGASINAQVCDYCAHNFVPYVMNIKSAFCLSTAQIQYYSTSYVLKAGCVKYSETGECLQCSEQLPYMKVDETANTGTGAFVSCNSTCASTYSIILDNLDGRTNLCVSNAALIKATGLKSTITHDAGATNDTTKYFCRYLARTNQVSTALLDAGATPRLTTIADYACVTPQMSADTDLATYPGTNTVYPFVLPVQFKLDTAAAQNNYTQIRTYMPYSLGETDVKSKYFNYNGFAIGAIKSGTDVGKFKLTTNCALYFLMPATFATATKDKYHLNLTDDTGFYYCMKCNFGYALRIVTTTAAVKLATVIQMKCDVIMDTCDTNIFYSGFPAYLNAILSCHQCKDSNNLLGFMHNSTAEEYCDANANCTGATSQTFLFFQIPTVQDIPYSQILCLPKLTATGRTPVSDCQVYVFFGQKQAAGPADVDPQNRDIQSLENDVIGMRCVSCKPGYKAIKTGTTLAGIYPTTLTSVENMIGSCEKIDNCETSTSVNACTKCKEKADYSTFGYTVYYAFGSAMYNSCEMTFSPNCFIVDTASAVNTTPATIYKCKTCMPGHFLNYDGYCEAIKILNCDSVNMDVYDMDTSATALKYLVAAGADTYNTKFLTYLGLSSMASMNGCSKCKEDYLLVQGASKTICLESTYLKQQSVIERMYGTSAYISKCKNYKFATTLKCMVCEKGYTPSSTNAACTLHDNYQNCTILDATDYCNGCDTGYQLTNSATSSSKCVLQYIENCATYNVVTTGALKCATCNVKYTLSTDELSCTAISVENCNTIDVNGLCTGCSDGYVLFKNSNTATTPFCYKIPQDQNCLTLDDTMITSANGYKFTCTKCPVYSDAVFGVVNFTNSNNTTLAKNTCMKMPLVEGCTAYAAALSFLNNQYVCTACSSGFYFNSATNKCIIRTYISKSCLTYVATEDKCQTCQKTTYLDNTNGFCLNYPNGIYKCKIYSASNICTQCEAHYYLNEGFCSLSTTIVDNCTIYSSNANCSKCDSGYYLESATKCTVSVASNCITNSDANTCSECNFDAGYGFKTDTTKNTVDCVLKNIANCIKSENTFPFKCTQCAQKYYPNTNGECTLTTEITNCDIYDSSTTCSKCISPFVLSTDKAKCLAINSVDPNCDNLQLLSTPICQHCKLNYKFVDGVCKQCKNDLQGCLNCPYDNQTECLVCAPNYYMQSQGVCLPFKTFNQENTSKPVNLISLTAPVPGIALSSLTNSSSVFTVFFSLLFLLSCLI